MTGIDNRSMQDPTDSDFIKSVVSNPLGESTVRSHSPFAGLPPDVWSALKHMQKKFGSDFQIKRASSTSSGLLHESDDSIELNVNNREQSVNEVLINEGSDDNVNERDIEWEDDDN
jgi:hypothetical protein